MAQGIPVSDLLAGVHQSLAERINTMVNRLRVEDAVIVELKAAAQLIVEHEVPVLNYLPATPFEVGLLLNFGPKPEFRRKVFDNARKTITWR